MFNLFRSDFRIGPFRVRHSIHFKKFYMMFSINIDERKNVPNAFENFKRTGIDQFGRAEEFQDFLNRFAGEQKNDSDNRI